MDKRAVRRSRLANKPSGELLQATASGKSRESLRMTGECRDYDEVENLACCSSLKKEKRKKGLLRPTVKERGAFETDG